MNDAAILSRTVDVQHLPAEPVVIEATPEQRVKLAAANDLVEIRSFTATVTLSPGVRGSVTVDGRVAADIVQTCVVSLVPLDARIDEPFTVRFVRRSDAPPEPKPGAELVFEAGDPDPPEVLDGPTIDIGALAEEAFVLAIDPYPRAPGAALPREATGADDAPDSPFAVLAELARSRKDGK